MRKSCIIFVIGLLAVACVLITGCTGTGGDVSSVEKEATLVSTPYGTAQSSAHVLKEVLEDAGYAITIKEVDVGIAWAAVASGDVDFIVDAWLPTCHGNYLDKYEDKIDFVRKNLIGTRCGLAVPTYVPIDSIDELNGVRDKFDGTIIGIEPGAGIMQGTDEAIEAYGLEYTLQSGSEVGMLASLKSAIDRDEWVVVTAWSPHWKFIRWDLKYLEDPENVYGDEEYIATYARQGLKDKMPDLYAVLERFTWTPEDMASVMYDMEEHGMTPEEAAEKWVQSHPDQVEAWTGSKA
ncbi:glycine betaine ABC transporter substrate-binding protein [Methanofollis sp. W23]|uniref:glycine betaine ABC transporter substrate-binding protein n=1 Tax=Methanofollis sp. W23 TaxID=2817849 RepID=UPI001AEADDA6|nr:glycine betaine ABC transporter substrate-binding protein [Methanofollis sp. W23]